MIQETGNGATSDECQKSTVRQATNSSSVSTHTVMVMHSCPLNSHKDRKHMSAEEQQQRLLLNFTLWEAESLQQKRRFKNLLPEEFTPDASPQFGACVGVGLRSRRFIHATPFLQALTHRVQVTVRDHDLRHPTLANTHAMQKTTGMSRA